MTYTVRYNRTTNHIDGIECGTGTQMNYPKNACPAITRSGLSMGAGIATDDIAEALKAAKSSSRKICKTCEKNANEIIAALPSEVPADAQKALAKAEKVAEKIRNAGGSALARYAADDASRIIITGATNAGATYELYFNGIAFAYGTSKFTPVEGTARKVRKVRNVSELLRLL